MSFKAKAFRATKMSRNLSRHSGESALRQVLKFLGFYNVGVYLVRDEGVSCDACGKSSFSGKRYKCLMCYDFDLCTECYESGETGTSRHSTSHPMQCILTRVDSGQSRVV